MKSTIKKSYLVYLKASIYLDKSLTLSKVKLSSFVYIKTYCIICTLSKKIFELYLLKINIKNNNPFCSI